jgi:hypoxanthine phosphoribosyltransferase
MKTRPLFDEETIAKRIVELGAQINSDYQGCGDSLLVICILKGAFMFTADLVRQIKVPIEMDFMGVASYEGTQSSGQIKVTRELTRSVSGKHVLVVEDIVDTGATLDFLHDMIMKEKPGSLKFCTLLSKPEAHQMKTAIDYVGFEISREFVIGYGLDLDQKYREIPYIAQVIS